jgi:hypothetical protein
MLCADSEKSLDIVFFLEIIQSEFINFNLSKSISDFPDFANQSIWLSDAFLHKTGHLQSHSYKPILLISGIDDNLEDIFLILDRELMAVRSCSFGS